MLWFQVILLCAIVIKNTNSKEILVITECQDQLLKTDLNKPIAKIVDVIIGSTIRLECNIWYENRIIIIKFKTKYVYITIFK